MIINITDLSKFCHHKNSTKIFENSLLKNGIILLEYLSEALIVFILTYS